ncbi:hypothetical protein ACQEU5_07580 [Marinactinospora thermotolerans]|uniref:PknH-like extracellular domain-containing protein n=1 Tax=Marinactinospora thermotolerans DSM 45154 TaxID=1122192 RepID=A0A1T4R4L1_9ACTN|nr:hypothetical protein [Marinactinospora thermotolerans]SKA10849.1 hypothetical protein SAMN02745673_02522 [Marinactinospora thermotolerans DSM 45154]
MEHPRNTLKASVAALGAAALLCALSGCAGNVAPAPTDPGAEAAARLGTAQMVEYGALKFVADQSETGTYERLASVRQLESVRQEADSDKPACMDAANRWGRIPEVRTAPASLATFVSDSTTVTHLLLALPEETARAVLDSGPPRECASYTITLGGVPTSYRVRDLDLAGIGEESRAFSVSATSRGERVWMHNLVYRDGGHVAMTTLISGSDDTTTTLEGFADAALERERRVLLG